LPQFRQSVADSFDFDLLLVQYPHMSTTYVHKFLADAGCGSRRDMITAMKLGRVKVNNRTIQDPRFTIDPDTDVVMLGKQVVKAIPPRMYLMLNKQEGVITTNSDPQGRRTVFDLLPEKYQDARLFAVGRLDEDTTGLLILTNDGKATFRLTHPRFEHPKEYEVTVRRQLSDRQIRMFQRGIMLEDGKTAPAQIRQLQQSQKITYRVIIHEGRKRQIRRMFEHIGNPVITLKRLRMGQLWLDPKLKPGQVRPLTKIEIEQLSQAREK
jgi:23S rRNA pseudouridine2605 synthase